MRVLLLVALLALSVPSSASTAPLTVDDAVRMALQRNTSVVQSQASTLSARSGLWSAYSQMLPSVAADWTRSGSLTGSSVGAQVFGSVSFPSSAYDAERYSGSYGLTGRWAILSPTAIAGLSSAQQGMRAANLGAAATRADVRLETHRRFYAVVKSMHLARVASQALRAARDDERRVNALFAVGSVSKSDLLKARVRTAQSQLDSLLSDHAVVTQRIALANQLGMGEGSLGEVDSTLTANASTVEAATLLTEAQRNRPDLMAAEASLRSAELGLRSARWSRLPSVSISGSWTPKSTASSKQFYTAGHDPVPVGNPPAPSRGVSGSSESKSSWGGQIAIGMNLFDGFATDARIAAARAQLLRARETREALLRNLEGEVHQAVLAHQEAMERESLARSTVAAASENLNLVQQKYNVGSATILDLIDSQVQLQRAQSDLVSALADIRIAEAVVQRVRGQRD